VIKGAFKQRMVGAIFILSLGVILIPVILDAPSDDPQPYYSVMPETPSLPEVSEVSKINYVFNGLDEPVQVTPEVAAPQIAVVQVEPQPKPPVAPPKAPVAVQQQGEWTIQLGAFSSTENANELLQRLSQKGFESYLKTTPGKKLVRVFVAPGVQKEKAQALQSKLDSQLGLKGILVRYQEP
jgi:DedD protein